MTLKIGITIFLICWPTFMGLVQIADPELGRYSRLNRVTAVVLLGTVVGIAVSIAGFIMQLWGLE